MKRIIDRTEQAIIDLNTLIDIDKDKDKDNRFTIENKNKPVNK